MKRTDFIDMIYDVVSKGEYYKYRGLYKLTN